MALSAVVTILNLALCLIVGLRLWRVGLQPNRLPELALAIYFLASPFLSTICQGLVYGGLVDPTLALAPGTSRIVLGTGILGMAVGGAAICVFIKLSFWSGSGRAWVPAIAGSALALGGFAFEGWNEGFTIELVPGVGHWTAWAGRTFPMVWLTVESLRYWRRLRRREAVGLADAVIVNRFLLWAIFSAATFCNLAADLIAHVLYTSLAGTTTELVFEVLKPVLLATMATTMILSMISTVALFLTFFSPARYRAWLESRSPARRVA